MPKHIHCARCGKELAHRQKAGPVLGTVLTVVEPHECEEGADFELVAKMAKMPVRQLENEPFVQKLNEVKPRLDVPLKDQRKDRDTVSSTAPQNLRGMIDTMIGKGPTQNSGREFSENISETESETETDDGEEMEG